MKKLKLIILGILILALLTGCSNSGGSQLENTTIPDTTTQPVTTTPETTEQAKEEYYKVLMLESTALAQNTTGEDTEKEIGIYLPPSYYQNTEKRYPVVYYLHGFGESANGFIYSKKDELNKAFKNGAKEFIFVGVDGTNVLGGSFYANSPVIGNWEDYVVTEVVPMIDKNFRTINSSDSRGICGFSMGGFGAVNIALKHPDVFGALFTMSPGLLADNDIKTLMESWQYDRTYQVSYAGAFAPNVNDTENYGYIPELSGTPEDNKIVKDWENGFGNINQKLDAYLALNKPLRGIKIIYGELETYPWITNGCLFLSDCLKERSIEHSIERTSYGHVVPLEVMDDYFLPFFNENLVY